MRPMPPRRSVTVTVPSSWQGQDDLVAAAFVDDQTILTFGARHCYRRCAQSAGWAVAEVEDPQPTCRVAVGGATGDHEPTSRHPRQWRVGVEQSHQGKVVEPGPREHG